MISEEWQKVAQKAVRWPCGVCGRSVGNNSIQRTSCQKWIHKKCSGKKGSISKVMKSFIRRGCMNWITGTGRASVDIGVSANLELVDKFCYLGDMLSVDGDAVAAVEARIRTGWNKFRQLVPLLTNKDVSLSVRGRLYSSCAWSSEVNWTHTCPSPLAEVSCCITAKNTRRSNHVTLWLCNHAVKRVSCNIEHCPSPSATSNEVCNCTIR